MSNDLPQSAYLKETRSYKNNVQVAFGGSHKAKRPIEDNELTHVGPSTPCGEYFRRFWIPVALASELSDVPLRIRILGEDLVVFRNKQGALGLLHLSLIHI